MADAKTVAQYVIHMSNEVADLAAEDITNLRLNKLLFFVQAASFQRFNKPIFTDDIQAWKLGPVVSSVYHKYKTHGKDPIQVNEVPSCFSKDEKMLIIDTIVAFLHCKTSELIAMSHAPETPWAIAYNSGNEVISNNDIAQWVQNNPLDIGDKIGMLDVVVPEYTADGKPIFPAEWEDDFE